MATTVARLLADSLEAHGVDQMFCVPGESYVGLTSVLTERNSIRMIVCRHEGGAGFMAVADGRLRARAGVCIVSRGPGLSNAMVSLHSAFHDATPMVMLVGQVERRDFGRQALQEQNYSKLLSDITKCVIEVNEPEQASEAIARAFHIWRIRHTRSGRGDPAGGYLRRGNRRRTQSGAAAGGAGRAPQDLDRLADMLAKAERPLVLVGGALLSDTLHDKQAFADLRTLAEDWVLPVCPTHRRPQLFDARHPNYGGYMGIRVPPALIAEMKKADLIVSLGERMTDSVSQSYTFPGGASAAVPLVHVWPDANEIGRVWRVDLGIPADPHEVIKGLLPKGAPKDAAKRADWVSGLHRIWLTLLEKKWEPTTDGINFAAIVCEVDKHLADDAVVTSDAGNFGSFIHRYIGFKPGQEFLSSIVGAMGSGMPMAVAATLRRPGRQVVAFMGDGGALMMGNELATALQYGGMPDRYHLG